MTTSTKNVKLGPCKIYFGGQDLGLTQGGVEVSVSTDTHEVNVDQFGKTKINELIMSRNVMVKCPLAETTLRNMLATMPGSTLVSDGVLASGTLTFAANPTAATTFTIAGQAFTFHATVASLYAVKLGATLAATMVNIVDTINRAMIYSTTGGTVLGNAAGGVTASNSAATPTVVNLYAGDPGVAGNAVTTVAASGGVAGAATLVGGVAETKARVEVKTGVGTDLLSIAKVLRLHPTGKADTDFSDDFVVYQAATAGALTYAYKVDTERVYSVEFNGYPDSSDRLFSTGDALA